jgi:hypothetical protein
MNEKYEKDKVKVNLKVNIFKLINILFFFIFILKTNFINNKKSIKIALCTMGKRENLYAKEFIDYYIKLGLDSIFIYDDNNLNSEKISDVIDYSYKKYVTIYETKNKNIFNQSDAFTDCYIKNKQNFNWFLMVDMDEFLYIKNDKLKNYLQKKVFNKCDFIKFHWLHPTDNNHLHYENKSLFERFKKPYRKSIFLKSMVRGNIKNLKYWVHSAYISPFKNISCNNIGKIINNKNINIEFQSNINVKKAYIIHFNYKSTEEYINKYKRGYSNWFEDRLSNFLDIKIKDYFRDNEITKNKIDLFEKELKLNLSEYKKLVK